MEAVEWVEWGVVHPQFREHEAKGHSLCVLLNSEPKEKTPAVWARRGGVPVMLWLRRKELTEDRVGWFPGWFPGSPPGCPERSRGADEEQ